MPKALESKAAGARRRSQAYRDRQAQAKATAVAVIPEMPDYLPPECSQDWGQTAQKLYENGLLTPPRLAYLEQFCMLRAKIRHEGIGSPASVHTALKSVTTQMWRPSPDDTNKNEPTNPFADL